MVGHRHQSCISTRFKTTKELHCLLPYLDKLHKKEVELRLSMNHDPAHPTYKKSVIITNLNAQIEEIISQFNSQPKASELHAEILQIITTVTHLKNTLIGFLDKYNDILNTQRSKVKDLSKKGLTASAITSTFGVGLVTGSLFFAALPLSGAIAIEYTADKCGLTSSKTASVVLLEGFISTLLAIDNSLHFLVDEFLQGAAKVPINALCCPITLEKMQNPVVCLLDNRMYEKKAITQWLMIHRTSPFNREVLKENQSIDDVLIENISLRQANEEYDRLMMAYEFSASPSAPPLDDQENVVSKQPSL